MTRDKRAQELWSRTRYQTWRQIQIQAANQVRDRVGEQVWLLFLSQGWDVIREQAREDYDDAG